MSDSLKTFIENKFALRTLSSSHMKQLIDRKKTEISRLKLKKGNQRTSIFFSNSLGKSKVAMPSSYEFPKISFDMQNNQEREKSIRNGNFHFQNYKLKELNNYLEGFSFSNRPLINIASSNKVQKILNKEIKAKSFISNEEIIRTVDKNELKKNTTNLRYLISNVSQKHLENIKKLKSSFNFELLNFFLSQFLDDLSSIFEDLKDIVKSYKHFLKIGFNMKKINKIENENPLFPINNKIEIKQNQLLEKDLIVSPVKINFQLNKHLNLTSSSPLKVKYLNDKKIQQMPSFKLNNITKNHRIKIGEKINLQDINFKIQPFPTKLLKSSVISN